MKRRRFRSRLFLLPLFPLYLFVYFMYNSAPDEEGKEHVVSETLTVESAQIEPAIQSITEKKELSDFNQQANMTKPVYGTFLSPEFQAGARQSADSIDWLEYTITEIHHSSQRP